VVSVIQLRGDVKMANTQGRDQGQNQSDNRGFKGMDPERQREIAAEGGRAAHESGNAHEFTSEEAREAGSKGGTAAHEKGTAHEFDSKEAAEAGAKGGRSRGQNARGEQEEEGEEEQ
jgi:general stress protein YciG